MGSPCGITMWESGFYEYGFRRRAATQSTRDRYPRQTGPHSVLVMALRKTLKQKILNTMKTPAWAGRSITT